MGGVKKFDDGFEVGTAVVGALVVGLWLGLPGVTVGTEVAGRLVTTAGFSTRKGGVVDGGALELPRVTVGVPVVGPDDCGLGGLATVASWDA